MDKDQAYWGAVLKRYEFYTKVDDLMWLPKEVFTDPLVSFLPAENREPSLRARMITSYATRLVRRRQR